MSFDQRLIKGQRYNTAYLRVSRWHPFYARSRDKLEFFADGVYLGPDSEGVEPFFVSSSVRRALGDFGVLRIYATAGVIERAATEAEWLEYRQSLRPNAPLMWRGDFVADVVFE